LPIKHKQVTRAALKKGVAALAQRDADLARIVSEYGAPPLWQRDQGFPTLIHIILEQQVSLASARAAFGRLQTLVDTLTPEKFLELSDTQLRLAGFSRQKTRYGRALANAVTDGHLDLAALDSLTDEKAREQLTEIKGIGSWTADIYLLMALRRPDVWPSGDLALEIAMQRIRGWPRRPTPAEAKQTSEQWRPWRAIAARLLWQFYLQAPKRD
jgi:DNA-3-methyladenine glycosylase II